MGEQLGIEIEEDMEEEHKQFTQEILLPGTIVTLAAEKKLMDTFYLIRILKENCACTNNAIDDYGNQVKRGNMHPEGNFLEKIAGSERIYKLSQKNSFLDKENPFVQMEVTKKWLVLSGFSKLDSSLRLWLNRFVLTHLGYIHS